MLTVEALEDRTVPSFLAPINSPNLNAQIVGDFNNDGVPDLIVADYYQYPYWKWSMLLGKRDGTFQPGRPVDLSADPIQVADLNGDGKLDLITNLLAVQLGNGDGTFQTAKVVTLPDGQIDNGLAIGDVNNDGKLDLVVGGYTQTLERSHSGWTFYKYHAYIDVLLGKGDGSFQAMKPVSVAAEFEGGVALGDFNRDGKLDVLSSTNGVYLLLGNGDGTLQKPIAIDKSFPTFDRPIVADMNGDGKFDYLVPYWIDLSTHQLGAKLYLGNGDGTFQSARSLNLGAALGVAIGDFNHDGKVDLVTGAESTGTISIFLGNGDGSFQPAQTFGPAAGGTLIGFLVGDFNGDGYDDLALNYITRNVFTDMIDSATLSVLINNGHW